MKTWQLIAISLAGGVALGVGLSYVDDHFSTPVAPGEVRAELAAERIPAIREQAKTTKRAARIRVDDEVINATRDSSLVDYTNSRTDR